MKTLLLTILSSWMLLTSQAEGQQCSSTNTTSSTTMTDDSTECGAAINLQQQNDMMTVQAIYSNPSNQMQEVRYMLEVAKKGPSGISNSSQGGKAKVKAGEEVVLSSSTVDYREGNMYVLTLRVYEGETLICESEETISYE